MTDADPIRRLRELGRHIDPELEDRDVERVLRGVAQRGERTRQRRSLGLGLLAGGLVTGLLLFSANWLYSRGTSAVATTAPTSVRSAAPSFSAATPAASTPREISTPGVVLADGSRATPVDSGTELALAEDSARLAQLSVTRGRAHFEVAPQKERKFVVRAGAVSVTVIGTVFDVEVVADRVGVSVEHGAVAVDWGSDHARLSAGEKGWFPPLMVSPAHPAVARSRAAIAETSNRESTDSSPSAQELFARVDAARASGQTAQAAALLRQILRERGSDARAPLAAMTLGRMLLTELGQPREAAAVFADVRARGVGEPFAEDALAREVEAWVRAGDTQRARTLAQSYLGRYATGRYANKVRALAGLP